MKKSTLFVLWGMLYILCAGLGFIPEHHWLLTVAGIAFFIPGGWLLYEAVQEEDRKTILLIRNISALSLSLTAVFLVLNILSVLWSEVLGNILYGILVIVSSPMVCCGGYAVSIFLWACLLIAGIKYGKK